jgi:hypothetical protein
MSKSLTELTAEYYDLIGRDYHKDDDRHFYIKKIYSYGQPPYWQFFHDGYCLNPEFFYRYSYDKKINREEFPKRRSEKRAEQDMRIFLDWIIKQERKYNL